MSKTYLVGYYGMQNSGDDALLAATVMGAKRFLDSDELIINTPTPMNVVGVGSVDPILVEQQKFPAQNRLLQYMAAYSSNRVIFGGGSVIQNQRDIDVKRDLLTLAGGRGHLALGVGIGPFENSAAERSCAKLLNRLDFTGVRDDISLDIARAIAPKAHVEKTFDLAPSLLNSPDFALSSMERRGIAVCLCPRERLHGDKQAEHKRLKTIADALSTLYNFHGEPIIFLDFNGHPELGDRAIHKEVASMMDAQVETQFIDYDPNPFRVLQRMASFKAAVSMRLHGSIFGFMANTPVLSLNYHQKCKGWCDLIGMPERLQFDCNAFSSDELAGVLYTGLGEGFSKNTMSIEQAVNASMKNWRNEYVAASTENFRRYSAV